MVQSVGRVYYVWLHGYARRQQQVFRQHLADDEKRGRLMGLFAVAWAGLLPLGAIWMGTAATATSAPVAVGIGAAVCALYAVVVLVRRIGMNLPRPDQANPDRPGPGQSAIDPPR